MRCWANVGVELVATVNLAKIMAVIVMENFGRFKTFVYQYKYASTSVLLLSSSSSSSSPPSPSSLLLSPQL